MAGGRRPAARRRDGGGGGEAHPVIAGSAVTWWSACAMLTGSAITRGFCGFARNKNTGNPSPPSLNDAKQHSAAHAEGRGTGQLRKS
jgi:hypothetical protein